MIDNYGNDYGSEGDVVDVICDCNQIHQGVVRGSEGQLLEWTCPIYGLMRDVNA